MFCTEAYIMYNTRNITDVRQYIARNIGVVYIKVFK